MLEGVTQSSRLFANKFHEKRKCVVVILGKLNSLLSSSSKATAKSSFEKKRETRHKKSKSSFQTSRKSLPTIVLVGGRLKILGLLSHQVRMFLSPRSGMSTHLFLI